jgi:DNA-binding NtrC family response regulator
MGKRYQALSLSDVERQHIERTLRHHGGNRTRAALELGISRATLINKIKAYSLDIEPRGRLRRSPLKHSSNL